MEFKPLVEDFARHVMAQTEAFENNDARLANKNARRYQAVFDHLRAHGDAGRDALATLFTHPRKDVRAKAAVFLLRHRTHEAKAVLEDIARGEGLLAFGASQALQRWEDGTWSLDPG